jgi:hypothetical protein
MIRELVDLSRQLLGKPFNDFSWTKTVQRNVEIG